MSQATGASGAPVALPVNLLAYVEYPSMTPVNAIRVHLSGNPQIADLVDKAVAAGWNCAKPSSYRVLVQSSNREIPVNQVTLEPLSDCGAPIKPNVIIVLTRHIASSDEIVVELENVPGGTQAKSTPAKFPSPEGFGMRLTPQSAPGESLSNGKKRDVGQLNVAITAPDLVPSVGRFALYAKSTDLFSTDEKDSKSAFSGVLGVTRGLFNSWYSPFHLEENLQGNQIASSLSAKTSFGFTSLVPWFWTRHALNNGWIQAPSPPELTVNTGYTRRINQLVTSKTPLLSVNDYDLNPSIALQPVFILPNACAWLQTKLGRSKPTNSRQYCLGLQANQGMWYIPLDKTKAGSQRAEGYGDVSFLIPLSDIPFAPLANLISSNAANTQIRITYADSVNPANNYARSKQWSFGLEVIK